mmetsp:Transcript_13016/g.26658  ORF Transcript_13016/g.26658 Transcript_13016/m.26658 type:complete len:293 (+) Transcript_13016:87-965(+)
MPGSNPIRSGVGAESVRMQEMTRIGNDQDDPGEAHREPVNFHLQDPSCLGCADVCGCCPSKKQLRDEALWNRMVMCFFAICLMWATSLKVAAEIAKAFIATPSAEDVMDTCSNAYDVVNEEREEYLQCVEIQLGQCNINLAMSADEEADRIDANYNSNRQLLDDAKAVQNACSSAYSNGRFSLESWASNGVALPYLTACSEEDKQKINDDVGDISAVRSEAFTLSTEYSKEVRRPSFGQYLLRLLNEATFAKAKAFVLVKDTSAKSKLMYEITSQIVASRVMYGQGGAYVTR